MLKTQVIMEVKTGERLYQLLLPSDAPLGEVHDALYKMRSYVVDMIQKNNDVDKKPEESKVEELKPEEAS